MGTPWWQHLCCTVVTRRVWQPWVPTLTVWDYWNCKGVPALGCSWLPMLLAALFEGGGSLLPAGLIICAISGWLCFSSRILVISRVKAAELSTNALASASGLSRTMAINISPPSFGWGPVGRLASAQGSQLPCFRIECVPIPPGLSVLRWQFAVGHFGLLASQCEDEETVRQGGGRQVCDGGYCTANVTIFDFIRRGDFCPMAGSESVQSCRSVYPVFGSMYFRFHTALWDHWGALWLIPTDSLFMSYSLGELQIDEFNIAGRHHRCVVAIPLACGNLPEAHHHFVRWLCLALGRQLLPRGWPALVCISMHPVQASHVRPVMLCWEFWLVFHR